MDEASPKPGLSVADGVSVAATPGTTVVGSVATESVAASDMGSEAMMQVDEALAPKPAAAGEKQEGKKEGEEKKDEKEKEKEKPEPTEEILRNPCRVLKAQMQYISFPKEVEGEAVRYLPLIESRRQGFLLLTDTRPEEPEDLLLDEDKEKEGEGEKEPDPPEPFEWTDIEPPPRPWEHL